MQKWRLKLHMQESTTLLTISNLVPTYKRLFTDGLLSVFKNSPAYNIHRLPGQYDRECGNTYQPYVSWQATCMNQFCNQRACNCLFTRGGTRRVLPPFIQNTLWPWFHLLLRWELLHSKQTVLGRPSRKILNHGKTIRPRLLRKSHLFISQLR